MGNIINNQVFIIAEAGVNHNGELKLAKKLVDAAKEANVDAVKFQTFKPGEVTGRFAFKVEYQEASQMGDDRYEMSQKLALPYDAFRELKAYCETKEILFLSTPDGEDSLNFLVDELDIPIIKVGSTEVTHLSYLKAIAQKNRPIILSTGMSSLKEVEAAVKVIQSNTKEALYLLHCTTEYPAPYEEVNLKAMQTLNRHFNLPVGYSDHTVGNEAAIAAVALGAQVIEKHFTVDKSLPGPDHQASMTPAELAELVRSIRISEKILGDGVKQPTASELKNISGVRRGVVAAHPLQSGSVLHQEDLAFKRPNTGVDIKDADKVIGKKLNRDLQEDEVIQWEYLS